MRALVFGLIVFLAAADARAGGPGIDRGIMPLVKARCVKCHGPAKRESKLNLATPKGIARGGEGGVVVVPGSLEESPLWERVEADEMPPKEPLSAEEKAVLRSWIASGAAGLPTVKQGEPEASDHWAFAPASRTEPPDVRDSSRVRNDIDRFVQEALEEEGLSLGPEADRATLLRRVSFDLTGLPPTLEEIDAFLTDESPGAYEAMVERYLASPRHGERWGKYWLDAAGYADSNGYFHADSDRPLAYKYRDYVIRSWNADKPLDRFIVEQLAGDELAGFRPGVGASTSGEVGDLLAATHFLRNAPDGTGESDGNPDEVLADRFAVLEGSVQIIGSALLGLTVQCARCHDHKFEPFTQKEYYQLYAVLTPAFNLEDWRKPNERVIEAPTPSEREEWEARQRVVDAEISALNSTFLARLGRRRPDTSLLLRDESFDADLARLSARRRDDPDLSSAFEAHKKAVQAKEKGRGEPPGRIAWGGERSASAPSTFLLKRGSYKDQGPKVDPGVPAALSAGDGRLEVSTSEGATSTGRRLAFARWLTRSGSPSAAMLARVTSNRIWQHHFGRGIVASPGNFGYSGDAPMHPELLEFLADELAQGGWSAKRLHRMILGSATYRQSGAFNQAAFKVDPDNLLIWRRPLRRLDAEAVRDAMLAVSGELDQRVGGTYVPTRVTGEGEVVVDESTEGALRRSVFLQQRRTQVVSVLDVFDAPSIVTNCTKRPSTTVPLQALSLLNSGFATARARAFADRLMREAGPDPGARFRLAFRLSAGRSPSDEELAASFRFLETQPAHYPGRGDATRRSWDDFCQMLLASNAFLYVE